MYYVSFDALQVSHLDASQLAHLWHTTAAHASGLSGPMNLRILGKRWLRKTRQRIQAQLEERSALVIQKHFRGMQGIKRVRQKKKGQSRLQASFVGLFVCNFE